MQLPKILPTVSTRRRNSIRRGVVYISSEVMVLDKFNGACDLFCGTERARVLPRAAELGSLKQE